MRLLLPISVSLLLAWQSACAQTADDFFNSGAHAYISNNIPSALQSTEAGLKQFPDDVKLKKLYELLKQQQQQSQNSQSQQNQNQQSQQNQSQQQKSGGQQNQQQQNQQNSQEQQKQQQQASGEKQENQNQQADAGQMTPEEAKRLLDAQKGDEQILQMQPQRKPEDQNRPVKDW